MIVAITPRAVTIKRRSTHDPLTALVWGKFSDGVVRKDNSWENFE
ncbi:hypothetical protein FTUN_8140 [Frigoriglobus tundricola]|uniref:Uncharacterized protein n=1 Tax=Frigoriglobus tundricola TaxID=2774151 RepID=A0A6M5Z280_9BACT|nr:hypothetical protein FTUN_8140 [Frigoriglobus tundricola]